MATYSKMSDKLDYMKTSVEDRLELVDSLVGHGGEFDDFLVEYYSQHYNPHINQTGFLSENTKVGKDLESMANYLLYAKDSQASDDTITDYRKQRNSNREASIENVIKVKEFKKETNKSIIKVPKIKVSKQDRFQHPELAKSGEAIELLSKMIRTKIDSSGKDIQSSDIRRLKWIRTDIQKDEIAVKNELKGYIRFQNISESEEDSNALSHIRFDDIDIIRILIENYSSLKENSYDDTYGYMKTIIFTLEELIDMTDFEDYMADILMWKIEGMQYDEMISILKEKYDLKITKPRLSKTTREIIPKMIVDTYKQQKEDWIFTYIMKGNYKMCSSCNTNYLATTKYFNPNKTSKSGLRSVCRSCRSKKYRKDVSAKNE